MEVAVDFAKTVSNITVRLCDPYSYVPSGGSGNSPEGDAEAAAAAAARSDAAGHGPDALREEAGEARRTIGTMMEDLRTSEAEARERGEEGGEGGPLGGLASGEGREDAADEVVRRALEARRQAEGGGEGRGGPGEDAGVGRVLGGRRNDPTVDDILRPGRAGAERTGPPPSAAARKAAAGAVAVTLPWMLRKGILSKCKASQGLAMRTLQRLVKVCEKEALMPHLAELVATLIEGLSALEPQVWAAGVREERRTTNDERRANANASASSKNVAVWKTNRTLFQTCLGGVAGGGGDDFKLQATHDAVHKYFLGILISAVGISAIADISSPAPPLPSASYHVSSVPVLVFFHALTACCRPV